MINEDAVKILESLVVAYEDVSGLNCPMPILRTKKALSRIEGGQLLKVLTTDKTAIVDLSLFAKQTGHLIKAQVENGSVVVHYIEKKL